MQELVERWVSGSGSPLPARLGGESLSPKGRGRSVTVNLRESPLSWLKARGLVNARQFEAGDRLRADYERACLAPSVTMRWDASPTAKGARGPAEHSDPTTAQISAKRRFDAAMAALGPGLKDIAWRTICANESLPVSEKALGWPVRSGRLVLSLALDRLADGYGLS
ncbi:MAG: DUF6456 domain-containing protein [Sphingomonadaceae bacterium]